MKRNWSIYKITSPSGRVYIGKTTSTRNRFSVYRTMNCASQPLLYRSLKKYSPEAHTIEVIDSFIGDNDYANDKEMFWIRSFMSNNAKWRKLGYDRGLNMTDGAEGMTGYKYSDESKMKMSIAGKGKPKYKLRGRPLTEETKRKLSEKAKGKPGGMLGVKLSEERRIQIGKSKIGNKNMLGHKHTEESKFKLATSNNERLKPIIQYSLDGEFIKEFYGMRQAHRDTGIARNVIKNCVRGVTKNPEKFIFKYKSQ